jgi:hypothetical protein
VLVKEHMPSWKKFGPGDVLGGTMGSYIDDGTSYSRGVGAVASYDKKGGAASAGGPRTVPVRPVSAKMALAKTAMVRKAAKASAQRMVRRMPAQMGTGIGQARPKAVVAPIIAKAPAPVRLRTAVASPTTSFRTKTDPVATLRTSVTPTASLKTAVAPPTASFGTAAPKPTAALKTAAVLPTPTTSLKTQVVTDAATKPVLASVSAAKVQAAPTYAPDVAAPRPALTYPTGTKVGTKVITSAITPTVRRIPVSSGRYGTLTTALVSRSVEQWRTGRAGVPGGVTPISVRPGTVRDPRTEAEDLVLEALPLEPPAHKPGISLKTVLLVAAAAGIGYYLLRSK